MICGVVLIRALSLPGSASDKARAGKRSTMQGRDVVAALAAMGMPDLAETLGKTVSGAFPCTWRGLGDARPKLTRWFELREW